MLSELWDGPLEWGGTGELEARCMYGSGPRRSASLELAGRRLKETFAQRRHISDAALEDLLLRKDTVDIATEIRLLRNSIPRKLGFKKDLSNSQKVLRFTCLGACELVSRKRGGALE